MSNCSKSEKALIFLHIPKAGGTTLHRIIERQYKIKDIYTIHGAKVREYIDLFKELPKEERQKLKVVKGHMGFGLHHYLEQDFTYITMLREPVNRVISHYYHVLRTQEHYLHKIVRMKNLSLEEFVREGISHELNNGQTRALAGSLGNVSRKMEFGQSNSTLASSEKVVMLEKAKENIEKHFSAVGLTEQFDQSLFLFKRNFGWSNLFYKRENVGKNISVKYSTPESSIQLIKEYNELDLELYSYVKDRFERNIQMQGESFSSEVEAFRKANNSIYGKSFASTSEITTKVRKLLNS